MSAAPDEFMAHAEMLEKLRTAVNAPTFEGVIAACCEAVRASGVPLDRGVAVAEILHPQFCATVAQWSRDEGSSVTRLPHGTRFEELEQPAQEVFRPGAGTVQRQLAGKGAALDGLLLELRDKGYRDYLAVPVPTRRGERLCVSVATKASVGFDARHRDALKTFLEFVGPILEIEVERSVARYLLGTYLGHDVGSRVLGGQVQLGDGEVIDACVAMTDLRGFTMLTEEIPLDEVLEILNSYFDVVVESVYQAGGEVLKFMGDGLLAVFRVRDEVGIRDACDRARLAAIRAHAKAQRVNAARQSQGLREFEFVFAAHPGRVLYGNIGTPSRLDFTLIGPAVNTTSRLCALGSALKRPILFSESFAQQLGATVCSIGRHPLKGIRDAVEVYVPVVEQD